MCVYIYIYMKSNRLCVKRLYKKMCLSHLSLALLDISACNKTLRFILINMHALTQWDCASYLGCILKSMRQIGIKGMSLGKPSILLIPGKAIRFRLSSSHDDLLNTAPHFALSLRCNTPSCLDENAPTVFFFNRMQETAHWLHNTGVWQTTRIGLRVKIAHIVALYIHFDDWRLLNLGFND